MKKHHGYLWLVFSAILMVGLGACKKDEDPDLTNPVPEILEVRVSPTDVVEYRDSIVFEVDYRDGNGDLGENAPNKENLFLVDNRINVTETFRINELTPAGSDIPITGTLRVVLQSTGITDNSFLQTANYSIYLKDRAGNESNRITTEDILIRRN